ncbi:hypothetical protein KBY96_08820 [Cyanobium sp. ATX 6A2]|jgi:hypothetical protein|uniref:hypothetical protein n=1 Tax=Cyanobium sp. ATX 6A2 TaxID=2823700 RepID=UPI0020CC6628|nr:hypothetical protein [Cyanobium sp. ATX 6A2]MCP9888027.1 hypothetical protein [Cyanobium sp. ATX 6A2]
MLTSPLLPWRPQLPWRLLRPALLAPILLAAAPPVGAAPKAPPERPPGLVVLEERPSPQGLRVLAVYGVRSDPASADVRRVQLWQQHGHEVSLSADTLNCSATAPLRMTREGDRWIVRELNPGGLVTPVNRLDHLVWWAVCHPEQAGRDPAALGGLARELGYSGTLPESEQVLPGRAR